MTGTCCACGDTFDGIDDLRPYGRDGSPICWECAMGSRSTPESRSEAERRRNAALDAAAADAPDGIIRIGDGEPRPLNPARIH